MGFGEDVVVALDEPFVGVDVGDVLAVLAERAVKAVALVAVTVDEQHHFPTFRALLTALRDHSRERIRPSLKSRAKSAGPNDDI